MHFVLHAPPRSDQYHALAPGGYGGGLGGSIGGTGGGGVGHLLYVCAFREMSFGIEYEIGVISSKRRVLNVHVPRLSASVLRQDTLMQLAPS
jgi:hypothetical protein